MLKSRKSKVIKPKRLEPGDTIGLISPSGGACIKEGCIPDHMAKGLDYIEKMGYKYKLGKHALKRRGYLAGLDKDRVADLHTMFADKKIDAIFCLAGGYGTPRLLPYIDFELIRKNPKIIEGYSDITALLNSFHSMTGLVTFHGPMARYDFGRPNPYNKDNLWKAITKTEPFGEVPHPEKGAGLKTVYPGKAAGRLVGGNLSLLISLIGTPYDFDTNDAILFMEDVDEEPYRFDRMLNHLLLTGKLQKAKGIIIGESVDCNPNPPDKPSLSIMEILDDLIKPLRIPSFYGLSCGHGKYKLTLPIGVQASMDANRCSLVIEESAVR